MKTHESIALGIPTLLLPKTGTDLSKWAVIACDQFTSDPEYWQKVKETVGDNPSALNLIYPEVFLCRKTDRTTDTERARRLSGSGSIRFSQGSHKPYPGDRRHHPVQNSSPCQDQKGCSPGDSPHHGPYRRS